MKFVRSAVRILMFVLCVTVSSLVLSATPYLPVSVPQAGCVYAAPQGAEVSAEERSEDDAAVATSPDAEAAALVSHGSKDPAHLYAMLDHHPPLEPGPIGQIFERMVPLSQKLEGGRPMLLWYHWANQPKPFVPSLLILLFASVVISSVVPGLSHSAIAQCRLHFWRSFFTGILIGIVAISAIRIALITEIGWALAIFVTGALEISVLAGLSVMILAIGTAIGRYLKMSQWIAVPAVRHLAYILIGCLICAGVLQLPGIGVLPKVGIRLLGLLALVGLGGLYRVVKEA